MEFFETRNEMIKIIRPDAIIAEVGTFKGDFSEIIRKTLNPKELHLIDLWNDYTYSGDQDGNNESYCDLKIEYERLKEKYLNESNVKLHRGYSNEILSQFNNNYFDMIYIDADHSYEGCKRDLLISYNKIKNGGWIMGHDYEMNMKKVKKELRFGVNRAVNEFCKEYDQKICYKALDGCVSYGIKINKKYHINVIINIGQTI